VLPPELREEDLAEGIAKEMKWLDKTLCAIEKEESVK
jgi:hypothetical protein